MEDNWREDGRYAALSDPFGTSEVRYRVTDGTAWADAVDPAYVPAARMRAAVGWIEVQIGDGSWERLTT